MEIIKCDHTEFEIDDYSKQLLDEVIVLASLLDYQRDEYVVKIDREEVENCNFKFSNNMKAYTLSIKCIKGKAIETRLHRTVLRSIVLEPCNGPFGAMEKLKELL